MRVISEFKKKLKNYLKRKLLNLLFDIYSTKSELETYNSYTNDEISLIKKRLTDFTTKSELNMFATKSELEKITSKFEIEKFVKKNELEPFIKKSEFEAYNTQTNDVISAINERVSGFTTIRNQYGEWIHQLFTYIGSLYIFSDDINEKLNNVITAFGTNSSYLAEVKQNKKVVYTCLTGNYDILPLHSYLDYKWDYICFTDSQELLNMKYFGAWKIYPLAFNNLDNTKNARWHKTHPHVLFREYEESIWIDANIAIKNDWIFNLIEKKGIENKILIPIHYERDCIFNDIEYCVNILKKETRENADRMIDFLRKENFPENYGLNETNLIFRKHNDSDIISLMEDWWYFIENYTKRDQFSFSYVLWKHCIKPSDIAIPNIRPLVNSFRIDAVHRQYSAFSEPSVFSFPDYVLCDKELNYSVETQEQYGTYYRRAGWVALNDNFDIFLKANKQFYKSNKVKRQDIMNKFCLMTNNIGFDVKISFFDNGEGDLVLYIVNHTKKEIYMKEIK